MTLKTSLSSLLVTLGLRGAKKRALEGPVFRSVSGLGRLKHGTVDAEMIRSGCICVPDTHTEALDDSIEGGLDEKIIDFFFAARPQTYEKWTGHGDVRHL